MEKHELALHHAMKALILIQDELGERLDQLNEAKPDEVLNIQASL